MLLTTAYAFDELNGCYRALQPAILQVNRQTHAEAVDILHGENIWIIAEMDDPGWPRIPRDPRIGPDIYLPILSSRDPSCIKHPALRIKYKTHPGDRDDELRANTHTCVFGEEGIEYFVDMLWTLSSCDPLIETYEESSLTFELCSSPFHPSSNLRSICFQPFRLVRGIGFVEIKDNVGGLGLAFCEELEGLMTDHWDSTGPILEFLQTCIQDGDKAHSLGDFAASTRQYRRGMLLFHHAECQYEAMTSEDAEDLCVGVAAVECHYARSLLNLGQCEVAQEFCERLLRDNRLRPFDKAIMGLCLMFIHYRQGEKAKSDRLFEKTLNLPIDQAFVLQASFDIFPTVDSELRPLRQANLAVSKEVETTRTRHAQDQWNESIKEFFKYCHARLHST